jgi:23S rRNA (cytidine1920-2'-O)/16S rRNA (cytidine1409-2'-O)-methyltransferase
VAARLPKPGAGRGRRLDERVVADGLADSTTHARALILAGVVLVDDVPLDKAGQRIPDEAIVRLKGVMRRYVSRGGDKLAGALEDLGVDPTGLRCLDVGASTGGFTDCLLQAGARHVVALDVGPGQLHSRLRNDPRVSVVEQVNARDLSAAHVDGQIDLIVADVSFISLSLLVPRFCVVAPRAEWLLMIKPQFEVARDRVGPGGVVRDESDREAAVTRIAQAASDCGHRMIGRVDSRLAGPKGNVEVFARFRPTT